jgi:hypothetical protein
LATFSVHFDGPITVDHKVSIRVLAKTYEHMQRSIDRAFLIERYGNAWKHARLKANQYRETEFLAEYPREGGIVLDAVKREAGALIDRVANSIRPVFESAAARGLAHQAAIADQIAQRREYVEGMGERTQTFEQVRAAPPAHWASAYSNRAVVKEIDQLVAQVVPARLAGSVVDITLIGERAHLPFQFTPVIARRFHVITSERELGAPMILTASIRTLDRGNRHTRPSARMVNISTGREAILHFTGIADLERLRPFFDGNEVRIFVSPIVEALGFDLNGGDYVFLAVA